MLVILIIVFSISFYLAVVLMYSLWKSTTLECMQRNHWTLALTHWCMDTEPLEVSCGVYHEGCELSRPWTRLLPAHPTDHQLELELGNLEARMVT